MQTVVPEQYLRVSDCKRRVLAFNSAALPYVGGWMDENMCEREDPHASML